MCPSYWYYSNSTQPHGIIFGSKTSRSFSHSLRLSSALHFQPFPKSPSYATLTLLILQLRVCSRPTLHNAVTYPQTQASAFHYPVPKPLNVSDRAEAKYLCLQAASSLVACRPALFLTTLQHIHRPVRVLLCSNQASLPPASDSCLFCSSARRAPSSCL